jgi:hypothetical protein
MLAKASSGKTATNSVNIFAEDFFVHFTSVLGERHTLWREIKYTSYQVPFKEVRYNGERSISCLAKISDFPYVVKVKAK